MSKDVEVSARAVVDSVNESHGIEWLEPYDNDMVAAIASALQANSAAVSAKVWSQAIDLAENAHAQYKNQSSLREAIVNALEAAARAAKGGE